MNWFLTWPLNQSYVMIQGVGNLWSTENQKSNVWAYNVRQYAYVYIYIYFTMSNWTIDHVAMPWYVYVYIYIYTQSYLYNLHFSRCYVWATPRFPPLGTTRPGFSSAERIPEHVAVSALLSWAPREGEPRHIAGGLVMACESLAIQWLAMENHHFLTGKTH